MATSISKPHLMLRTALLCLLLAILGYVTLYLWRSPFQTAAPADRFELLAHRGTLSILEGQAGESDLHCQWNGPTHAQVDRTILEIHQD